MHREPEWDAYARAEAIAGIQAERYRCGSCGIPDAMVEIKNADRLVTWPDGRKFMVKQYRCMACASEQVIDRGLAEAEADHKPKSGVAAPADGRRLTVTEIHESVKSPRSNR